MDKNETFFYVSGFFSISFFLMLMTLFFNVLLAQKETKSYGLKKDQFVSISLDMALPTTKMSKKDMTQPAPPKQEASVSKPEASKADISSLFSNVSAQKIVYKKEAPTKTVEDTQLAQIQKRIQTTQKRESTLSEKLESLEMTATPSGGKPSASSADEVDAYMAEIQAIVYERFFPPPNTEGQVAIVRVWLDASGKLKDWRVISYAGNTFFNQEVDRIKSRIATISFPKNPKGVSMSIDIKLVAKE